MLTSKQRQLIFISLAALVQAQENSSTTQSNNFQTIYVVLFGLIATLTLLILYDRRQDYAYLRALRNTLSGKFNTLFSRIRPINKPVESNQTLGMDDQVQTDKRTIGFIQSQKTFIQADIASIQQTTNTSPSHSDYFKQMNIQEQTPQVNLKEAFDKNQKKKKSNKSKSKLKNQLQILKSEVKSEKVEREQKAVQELQNSLDFNEA